MSHVNDWVVIGVFANVLNDSFGIGSGHGDQLLSLIFLWFKKIVGSRYESPCAGFVNSWPTVIHQWKGQDD